MFHDAQVQVERLAPSVTKYVRRVKSWDAARQELEFFPEGWLFRGQRDARWGLRCRLDRARDDQEAVSMERLALQEVQESAHLYMTREPESDLEWLALIQHHGGPTRLLDVTKSPYVAAFFALEAASEGSDSAVWGIEEWPLHRVAVKRLAEIDPKWGWLKEQHRIEAAVNDQLRTRHHQPVLAPVRPYRINARMSTQQGLFLALGDPSLDAVQNLVASEPAEQFRIVQVVFPRHDRARALAQLRSSMNISRAPLFPGLDGLSQSTEHLMLRRQWNRDAFIHVLGTPTDWPGGQSEPPSDGSPAA